MHHLVSLIADGTFSRHPDLVFIFCDGGSDVVTPYLWRMDTFWRAMRDQTPWVDKYPSQYLVDHVRFCFSGQEGPPPEVAEEWMASMGKEDLLLYASNYPYWSTVGVEALPAGLGDDQRRKILGANAERVYKLGEKISA
jgi:predicted TIM-barrel fold metal-dependent hydrolase